MFQSFSDSGAQIEALRTVMVFTVAIGVAKTINKLWLHNYPVHMQDCEKSIVIDIRLRYSLLFVHRMHWDFYFFE